MIHTPIHSTTILGVRLGRKVAMGGATALRQAHRYGDNRRPQQTPPSVPPPDGI